MVFLKLQSGILSDLEADMEEARTLTMRIGLSY